MGSFSPFLLIALLSLTIISGCFPSPPARPSFNQKDKKIGEHQHIGPALISDVMPGEGLSGSQLYAQNCQVCHGILGNSTKKGRSKQAITSAISQVADMQSIKLNDEKIQAIADALAQAPTDGVFGCAAGDDQIFVASDTIKPLSRTQYQNTLNDLFGRYGVLDRVRLDLNGIQVPTDKYSPFDNYNVLLRQSHFDSYLAIARALSEDLVKKPAFIKDAFGSESCLESADLSPSCLTAFTNGFAAKIYRRALRSDDKALLEKQIIPEARAREEAQAILMAMLMSGDFTFHMQADGEAPKASDPTLIELSSYELASRLSYALWETMPDDELFQLAASGQLKEERILAQQVDRLLAHEKAKIANARFFTEWLQLKTNVDFSVPQQLLGNVKLEESLKADLTLEAGAFVNDVVFNKKGGYEMLLTDASHFAKDGSFQAILGETNSEERPGLLWRIVMSGSTFSKERNLIHSGKIIRERLLCDSLPPIPSNLNDQIQQAGGQVLSNMPMRDEVATKTKPAQCAGCHIRINPLAFAGANNYDWIGRFITEERRIQPDGTIASFAIDNAVENPAIDTRIESAVAGPSGLATAIVKSTKGPVCLIERRYTAMLGRPALPEANRDGCVMNRAYKALADESNGSVIDMLKALLGPEIRYRRLTRTNL